MKKTLILLPTAFNPSGLYRTATGDFRTLQYALGLTRLTELLNRNPNYEAVIVDNTVTPEWEMPKQLATVVAAMPRTRTVFFSENALGSQNKGCGIVTIWKAASAATNKFEGYEYVIHFEPRLLLLNFSFFDNFEAAPNNYILFETIRHRSTNALKNAALFFMRRTHYQCWTGLLSINRDAFLKLIDTIDVSRMLAEKQSLEEVVHMLAGTQFSPVKRLGLAWHDGSTNTYRIY